jgi:hypothetical protein
MHLHHSQTDVEQRVDKFSTLVDFCKAKRKGFEGLVDYGQPLIEVSNLPSLINRLTPTAKTFVSSSGGMAYSAKCTLYILYLAFPDLRPSCDPRAVLEIHHPCKVGFSSPSKIRTDFLLVR